MATGGVWDLYSEIYKIYSFDVNDFIDVGLDSATVDTATRTIRLQFTQTWPENAAVTVIGTITLTDLGEVSQLDESITLKSNVGQTVSGRLYVVTDFDVDGTQNGDSATVAQGGARIEQIEGSTVAVIETTGAPPDAFDVAPCCLLGNNMVNDVFTNLAKHTSVLGPADIQSALSWDRVIGAGQSASVSLRKTVDVPEPGALALGATVGFCLLALRWRACERRGEDRPA
jgi:hypothetical protein